jgi:hypothetical protein
VPFYSTAATIILVLFLTVAYQTRYFAEVNPRSEERADRERLLYQWLVAMAAAAVAAVGEVNALRALERHHATSADRHIVLTALILLGTAVVTEPMLRVMLRMPDGNRWRYWTIIVTYMGAAWLIAIIGLLNVYGVSL